jgi:hypothetical protein
MSPTIRVRNLREGEADLLPPALRNHGMAYLIPEWAWVVESVPPAPAAPPTLPTDPISILTREPVSASPSPAPAPAPFALIVASQAHSWLLLWRILTISPLPSTIPLTWFMEAVPQVLAEAARRGCVGFVTLLADDRPEEVKMARIILRLSGGGLLPFQGSIGAGVINPNLVKES